LTCRVVATTRFAVELRNAPGELRGYVSAVVAVLRVDPTIASLAFSVVRHAEDECTVISPAAAGS
jgi:hypothetical protein